MPRAAAAKSVIPHSWGVPNWPEEVFPGDPDRARYILRVHREELLLEGALVRVGRDLVVIGSRYSRWLEKKAAMVTDYVIAPNRARDSAEAA